MVAPSFQAMRIVGETYTKNGKLYVDVKNEKTGTIRSVRWYSEAEYTKSYGEKPSRSSWNMKHARGFDNGPILVIRNNKPADEEWLKQSCARYAMGIGWHIVSTDLLPADFPPHFNFLLLDWDEFKIDDHHPKNPADLAAILKAKAQNKEWVSIKDL